jgi:RecJ-like exonuclease
MNTATALRSCRRCNGTGAVAHKHVLGGRCFGCGGTGTVRDVAPVAVDRTVTVLTIWDATGNATVHVESTGRVGVAESDDGICSGYGAITYTVPTEVLRRIGVSADDVARIDRWLPADDVTRAIKTAAHRYMPA